MANVLLNPSVYAFTFDLRDALYWASTQLEFYANCYSNAASGVMVEEFPSNPKKGTTINIKYPGIPNVSDVFEGPVSASGITELAASLVVEHHLWIRQDLTGVEHTLQLDDFNRLVMRPAMERMAQTLDTYVASKYKGIYQTDDAAFTSVTDLTNLTQIAAHVTNLDNAGAPVLERYGLLTPASYNKAAAQDGFSRADSRGAEGPAAARVGNLLPSYEVTWKKSKGIGLGLANNIAALPHDNRHQAGTLDDGSLLVNGIVAAGAKTMNADAGTVSGTWKAGDIFKVAGAPGTYVCTNSGTADGAGAATGIAFEPAAPTGGFADNAALTFITDDHVKNIIATPGALVAAAVPPTMVPGQASAVIQDPNGYSFTMNWHDKSPDGSGASVTFEMFVACVLARPEFASMVPTTYATG